MGLQPTENKLGPQLRETERAKRTALKAEIARLLKQPLNPPREVPDGAARGG